MKELDKIKEHLRAFEPQLEDREELKEGVIKKISSSKIELDYFFGWTDIVWLRRSLAVASVSIVMFFCVQQVFVARRIDSLEKRMISINTDKVLEYQREKVIANSVVFTDLDRKNLNDSIKVATGDLLDLVKSYRSLQAKYESMLDKEKTGGLGKNKQKL